MQASMIFKPGVRAEMHSSYLVGGSDVSEVVKENREFLNIRKFICLFACYL